MPLTPQNPNPYKQTNEIPPSPRITQPCSSVNSELRHTRLTYCHTALTATHSGTKPLHPNQFCTKK